MIIDNTLPNTYAMKAHVRTMNVIFTSFDCCFLVIRPACPTGLSFQLVSRDPMSWGGRCMVQS